MEIPKIKFDGEWDELCPIFFEYNNSFEQIGTGTLIRIEKNILLLTAAHVIDNLYTIADSALFIPTINGFEVISGTLYHRHLNKNELREDDLIDFSFYILSEEIIPLLHESFIPLTLEQLSFNKEYFLNYEKPKMMKNTKKVPKFMKEIYSGDSKFSLEDISKMNDIICDITLIFAGYPSTKSKSRNDNFYGEIVYYRGIKLSEKEYDENNFLKDINITVEFGKFGTMNKEFESSNSPKPHGINGGGIYKIIYTEKGFDRLLVGIGHTYKKNKHLFIGTNIDFCIRMIFNILERTKK